MPLAYATVAYGGVWALRLGGWNQDLPALVTQRFGLPGLPVWAVFCLWLLLTATTGLIRGLSTALGEEIGWRGFLVPELAKMMSFTKVSVLSGIIWTAWVATHLGFTWPEWTRSTTTRSPRPGAEKRRSAGCLS